MTSIKEIGCRTNTLETLTGEIADDVFLAKQAQMGLDTVTALSDELAKNVREVDPSLCSPQVKIGAQSVAATCQVCGKRAQTSI